ncbi:MAG: hypothetical protein ED559_01325 [Phycisphaera sp.]|nr:MAG: hypothetical protein ED559_01325 [Phycisphaera sp.]
MKRRLLALLPLAALVLPALGCLGSPDFTESRSYPEGLRKLEPSNIQLYRSGKTVYLSNTTATNFGPSTIWLNQWFKRDIDGFAIGETLKLGLSGFYDEFGDEFRGGGFFAARAPDLIVLAELEIETERTVENPTGRVLLPLIVVGQREE